MLDKVYLENRTIFRHWMRKHFNLTDEDIADLYQDAAIGFYDAVREGRLQELTASIQTYLITIGKHLALKRNRKMKVIERHEDSLQNWLVEPVDPFANEPDDRVTFIQRAFRRMEEPCYSILRLFYYQRLTLTTIAERLGYKNAQVVKSQKSRCMKKLTSLVKEQEDG